MLSRAASYEALRSAFRWPIPARYNIGADVSDRWAAADPERPAILHLKADGGVETAHRHGRHAEEAPE